MIGEGLEFCHSFIHLAPLPGHFPDALPHLEPGTAIQRLGATRRREEAGFLPSEVVELCRSGGE